MNSVVVWIREIRYQSQVTEYLSSNVIPEFKSITRIRWFHPSETKSFDPSGDAAALHGKCQNPRAQTLVWSEQAALATAKLDHKGHGYCRALSPPEILHTPVTQMLCLYLYMYVL